MRTVIHATLVALSGLTLYALGCAGDVNTDAGATTTSTSSTSTTSGSGGAGGQGGQGGQGGTGGEACVPDTEVCDGVDNNCDGVIDEGCTCVQGDVDDCYNGPSGTLGVGACIAGQRTCDENGTWGECMGSVEPQPEVCNNIDDDCNGTTDDPPEVTCGFGGCQVTVAACANGMPNECIPTLPTLEVCDGIDNDCDQFTDETFPGKGSNCDTGVPGVCAPGLTQCVSGVETCVALASPTPETCDSLDTDCDGIVDNNIPGTGGTCTTGIPGACSEGAISCKNGVIDCFPIGDATPEVCNQIDDNCDGQTDEGNPDGGATCVTGLGGDCDAGTMTCVSGSVICVADNASQIEICNGIDDQCDGQIDEDNPGGGFYCPTGLQGACADGTTDCQNGMLNCVPNTMPTTDVCNGLDDDCDGPIDENNPGGGAACDTGKLGICQPGTVTCTGGALVCKQNQMATVEICNNGLDDNCDGVVDPAMPNVLLSESFSNAGTPAGWTLDTEWEVDAATSGCSDPTLDTTPTADNRIAGVVIGGGGCASLTVHDYYFLTTPVIDTSGVPDVYFTFRRWLRTYYSTYMNSKIEVFDGSNWVLLWENGTTTVFDTSWKTISFDLTPYKNAQMQIRWGFKVSIAAVNVGQWNIDDVTLVTGYCQ